MYEPSLAAMSWHVVFICAPLKFCINRHTFGGIDTRPLPRNRVLYWCLPVNG